MSAYNILYYSNKCESSKQLIALMQMENIIQFFFVICTDNNPSIPSFIKMTPTIILKGIPEPYVAGGAFCWFAKIKQHRLQTQMQQMNNERQKYMSNINSNLTASNSSNILGFSDAEMSSMSDIFSFFANKMEEESQESLPQTYVPYNNIGKEFLTTIPIDENYRLPEKQQQELYQKMKMERESQDKQFKSSTDAFNKQYSYQKK
jgi:hypothetical protein